jgi:predicted AlkP superfamily phosphohydrolase/phosphomutase
VRSRLGGGNTAYHVPDGILITAGDGIGSGGNRAEVSILDAAPSLLALLNVEPTPDMRGRPGLFG